jgi:nitrate reductase delta subunit
VAAEPVHPLKLASLLLQYPGPRLREALGEVAEVDLRGLGRRRRGIGDLLAHYSSAGQIELEREYVETFDFSKRCGLYLTYHLHGDRRQRGVALLRLKQAYAAAGFEVDDGELPDFLPLMLEFAALAGEPGSDLLTENRVPLELIRASLRELESPYLAAIELVTDRLPSLTRRQLRRLRRLAAEGPPTEQVGLEPFAPPEVMPGDDGGGALPLVGGGR